MRVKIKKKQNRQIKFSFYLPYSVFLYSIFFWITPMTDILIIATTTMSAMGFLLFDLNHSPIEFHSCAISCHFRSVGKMSCACGRKPNIAKIISIAISGIYPTFILCITIRSDQYTVITIQSRRQWISLLVCGCRNVILVSTFYLCIAFYHALCHNISDTGLLLAVIRYRLHKTQSILNWL